MKEIKLIPIFLDCVNRTTYRLSILCEWSKPYYTIIKTDEKPVYYEAV